MPPVPCRPYRIVLPALLAAALAGPPAPALAAEEPPVPWLHRTLGAAWWAAGRPADAARSFAAAARESGGDPRDLRDAAVAALRAGDLAEARRRLDEAARPDPDDPRIAYVRGLLEKRAGDPEAARAAFETARARGGSGPELLYQIGAAASRAGDAAAAAAAFDSLVSLGPADAPRHWAPALRRRGFERLRLGLRDAGRTDLGAAAAAGAAADLSEEELERGPLLDPTPWPPPLDGPASGSVPAFIPEPLPEPGEIRWADPVDLDADGDVDLLLGDGQTLRDLRRTPAGWVDVTASRGLAGLLGVSCARAVDVDGDDRPDLLRGGGAGLSVQYGLEGAWEPPRPATREPVATFLALDIDADGDADVVAAGPSGPLVLRNRGDRLFEDATAGSGLEFVGPVAALAAGDLDDDLASDLVLVGRDGRLLLAARRGPGRWDVVDAGPAGVDGAFDVEIADLDGDGDLDVATAGPRGVRLATNDGTGRLAAAADDAVPPGPVRWSSPGGGSLWARDFDHDGRVDLLVARETGGDLALNRGGLRFVATGEPLRPLAEAGAWPVAAALLDGDDRLDLVGSRAAAGVVRNVGDLGPAVILECRGAPGPGRGGGAAIVVRTGDVLRRIEDDGRPLHVGLGPGGTLDALAVRWPRGLRQVRRDPAPGPDRRLALEDAAPPGPPRPLLWAGDGEGFTFLADVWTAALGRPAGASGPPGGPDHDETLRVPPGGLRPGADGRLSIRLTEEGREIVRLDRVRLVAVDHPDSVEVQPNEKAGAARPPAFGVHVLDATRPPLRAIDHRGRDVADRLLHADDRVVGDLPPSPYPGLAGPHTLEIDFGDVPSDASLTLHLEGWTARPDEATRRAIAQDPAWDLRSPVLEVPDGLGGWTRLATSVGFPGGHRRSIPVDLTGAFPAGRAHLRLRTTLPIAWDRARLQVGPPAVVPRLTTRGPDAAVLERTGLATPVPAPDGMRLPGWSSAPRPPAAAFPEPVPGAYTPLGDVLAHLAGLDDVAVVMGPGDGCTVSWSADGWPPLEPGRVRTWFVVLDGRADPPGSDVSPETDPAYAGAGTGTPGRGDPRIIAPAPLAASVAAPETAPADTVDASSAPEVP